MDLSPVLVGLLVAAPSLSGSLLRIPFSSWVDTTGGRKPFLVLLFLSVLGMLGLYLVVQFFYPDHMSRSLYPLLLLFGVLSGCGIATFSVGISQVAYWFPQKKQGSALGTYAGLGNLAPGMFSFLLPVVLASLGLNGSYLVWLVFLLIGLVLYYFLGKNAAYFQLLNNGLDSTKARKTAQGKYGQKLFPAGRLVDSLSISAKVWKTWVLVVLYFTTFGGFIALTAWFPNYWQSYFKTSLMLAGLLTAVYSILSSLIRVGGGAVADKIGGEKTAALSLGTMLAGSLLMTFAHSMAPAVLASVLMAVGMGVNNAAVFKLAPKEVPQAVGGAAGWVGGLGAFGGFAIPPLLGLFVRIDPLHGYATGFVVFAVLAIVSLLLVILLRKK